MCNLLNCVVIGGVFFFVYIEKNNIEVIYLYINLLNESDNLKDLDMDDVCFGCIKMYEEVGYWKCGNVWLIFFIFLGKYLFE